MIDVCLLLEGTYPYVAGGVSTWVHQLITSMKDVRFGIVFITSHSDPTRRVKYEVPQHVLYLKDLYLHDYNLKPVAHRRPKKKDFEILREFYDEMGANDFRRFPEMVRLFRDDRSCFDVPNVFTSKKIWDLLVYFYEKYSPGISFLDFFWTWRGTHLPLFQILQAEIPRAKVYHAVSTGYAGLLGAVAKSIYGERLFITEHGIYTHERMLEISQASWIFEQEKKNFRAERDLSFFKRWWIGLFKVMSHVSYQYADRIFTLYEGNKVRQVIEGADASKITIIPNGLDRHHFGAVQREERPAPQIGLIGRVVNIKDIKTFIQSARLVLAEIPQAQFYVIGPTDEEEDYYEECRVLVEALGLEDRVTFTGRVNAMDYYRFLDVVVLTSLSEAQPYVILEANACGIPVVATDVGACREMLEGRDDEDRLLGASGLVTEVANPNATAKAIGRLLKDEGLHKALSEAGRERVRLYYDQDDLLSRYLNIYEQSL